MTDENIEAIEQEKQEYLEEHPEEESENSEEELEEIEEDVEVEETEFSLTAEEIEEWIAELVSLKEEKGSIELSIDEENNLKINFEESEELDE